MDRRKCCVKACMNEKRTVSEGFHIYGLPNKNLDIRSKWLKWVSQVNGVDLNTIVEKNVFVCSDHFKKEVKGLKKLKSGAVPCIIVSEQSLSVLSDDHEPATSSEITFAASGMMASGDGENVASNVISTSCTQVKQERSFQSSTAQQNADRPSFAQPSISSSCTHVRGNFPVTSNFREPLSLSNQMSSSSSQSNANAFAQPATPSRNTTFRAIEGISKTSEVKKCFVNKCSANDNAADEHRHFHKLPKHRETHIDWCKWIGEVNDVGWENLLDSSIVICSYHFKDTDIGSRKVKKYAVPCIISRNPGDLYDPYSTVIEVEMTSLHSPTDNPSIAIEEIGSNLPMNIDNIAVENNEFDLDLATINTAAISNGEITQNTDIDNFPEGNNEFDFNLENDLQNLFIIDGDELITQNIASSPLSVQESSTISSRRKQKKSCAAIGCNNVLPRSFYTFPAIVKDDIVDVDNSNRCKRWIQASGNKDLLLVPSTRLHKRYFLCCDHFSVDQFYSIDCVKLLPNAVPTKFSCPSLDDTVMLQYPVWGSENIMTDVTDTQNSFDKLQMKFENMMHSVKWKICRVCKEKFYTDSKSEKKCLHSKNICPHFNELNDMDPGTVPPQLQGLSYVEEQLIAKVHPLISVFKLKGYHQYGYRGNIINFPQNVNSFAKKLPHSLDNLKSIITVRTSDPINPVDFHVRADKIRNALIWLKQHNIYYRDIEISEEALNSLPEDGNVFNSIQLSFSAENEGEEEEEDLGGETDKIQVQETIVPMIGRPTSKDQAEIVLGWPQISSDCINEFKTSGYIAMAFPTLFPTGQADLRNPREFNISPKKYFQHLLRYHDDRFAKHPRFRYFALNSIMRWSALSNGGVFVKKNSNFKNMNAEQLKQELEDNPSLLKKLMFYNSNLQGTKSFWYNKGQELLSMVEQIGLPTLFFTLSAADLHWPDLFKFLSPDEDLESMSDKRRRKLVEENPAKVDAFFSMRGKTFIKEVLTKKFQVDDLWYRIEYQHRGSPHIHGVMWLKDAPKFQDLSKSTEEELLVIAQYFEQFICTTHPDVTCPPAPIHPSKLRLAEIVDVKRDLAELLNRVQRHTKCSESYCLRKNKKKKKLECRFKFPVELRDHCEIVISEDGNVEFVTARNDSYLNKFNAYIIQTWRANIDISPVISKRALVNYLAKYISKSETQSQDMTHLMKELLKNTDSDKTAKSVIQRLYIQSCCERDYSAQETCHLILGLPLVSAGGREFVSLNFKVLEPDSWIEVTDDETSSSKSYIEKYMERSSDFDQDTLWNMAKKYVLPKGNRHSYGRDAIVRIFPKLSERNKNDSDDYYRQQVLLHLPWRYEQEFLEKYMTWDAAYLMNEQTIKINSNSQCNLQDTDPDEEEYEPHEINNHHLTQQFMTSSVLGPNQRTTDIDLGCREIDLQFDWHASASKYEQYGGIPSIKSFVQDKRRETTIDSTVPLMPSVTFTHEQQSVIDLLKLQIESIKNGTSDPNFSLPQTVIVQGKAGTGKSLLIHAMKSLIYEAFGEDSYSLICPTGVSALNINGSTIHSKLHIHPKTSELLPLKAGALHDFQQKFEKTFFVMIDEYSMIGCSMHNKIEKRLREAKDQENQRYGGLFIYFFGDVQQLAPVGDSAVYKNDQESPDYINGKLLYTSIDASIVLSQVQRQSNIDFQNLLNNVSTGCVTMEDYNILKNRFKKSEPTDEDKTFDDCIHLFSKRFEVDAHNNKMLRNMKDPVTAQPVPVARVPALHNCASAARFSGNEVEGLEPILFFAVGAKVMLRSNLWTEQGLVNGAIGHIVDILYDKDASPNEDPPSVLICHFPSYRGPYLNETDKTVPIQPMTKTWKDGRGQDCTRIQFPLAVAYACTIHKSQGLTLEKAFIDIGGLQEMSPGLTYTALSRVKSLEGMLLQPFSSYRLEMLKGKAYIDLRKEWLALLATKEISGFNL